MILHLLTDDKFADYAIAQFSAPEMQSDFVLIPSNNAMELVKQIDRCAIIKPFSPEFETLLNRLDQYTGIILHGLFWGQWQTPILVRVPKNVKVAWMFWGGEIYSRAEQYDLFLAPITKALNNIHKRYKHIKEDTSWEIPLSLYKRIDYCLTDMHEEYEYANQYTGGSFDHLWYNYYSLDRTVGALINSRCQGHNIWIGNSAAEKNNHLDILWAIFKQGLHRKYKDSEVIIPLSYGAKWMANIVAKVSRFIFGKRANILTTYMPLEEYNAMMLSCSTIILGYTQPAGQGNIITGLWLGMRVYLSEKSFAYDYFKRIGCKLYTIEHDLKRNNKDVFAPMSDEDVALNREILKQRYSIPAMHKKNLEIVKALS